MCHNPSTPNVRLHFQPISCPCHHPRPAVLVITASAVLVLAALLPAAIAVGCLTGEVAMVPAEHLGRDVFAAAHEVNDQQTIVLPNSPGLGHWGIIVL